jgi:MATE family multidrug resistance protein
MSDNLKLKVTYKQILQMSLPISFAILVPQFNFLINSFFLAQLGKGYMGASGITGVYYLIFSVIGFGLNNGLQALISRRAGQDRLKEIGDLFMQSIYITFFIALLGITITYTAAPYIFKNFTDKAIYTPTIDFLKIRIWGLPLVYWLEPTKANCLYTAHWQKPSAILYWIMD